MATFKKGYEIIQTTKDVDGVDIGGQKMKFGTSGGFSLSDASKAKDIDAEWGYASRKRGRKDKVLVMEVDDKRVEPGHNYTFSAVAMPFAKYDELGRRIPEGESDGQESEDRGEERAEEEGHQARGQEGAEEQEDGSEESVAGTA